MEGDVWKFPTLSGRRFKDEKVDHPTQKPLSISRRIVKHFSNRNNTVLIPFCGSGSECVACVIENRKYLSYELNKEYIKIAKKDLTIFKTFYFLGLKRKFLLFLLIKKFSKL